MISQKCQYALRAVFDLARRGEDEPVASAKLAAAQAIPPQFLEVIMGELKRGGFVKSKRGRRGGYVLAKPGAEITLGEIIRFVEGPIGPVSCVCQGDKPDCALWGECAFLRVWREASRAMAAVYDRTTLGGLVKECAGGARCWLDDAQAQA